MRAIAIIQARMSSKRLPGKVLMPLCGYPLLWHIKERILLSKCIDKIVVATSYEPSDDPIADFCFQQNLECERGSLQNVLERFITVLKKKPAQFFARITADCPMIDPCFIDKQIRILSKYDGDKIWLNGGENVFEGQGVRSSRSLKFIYKNSTDSEDLEHVGNKYLANRPEDFKIIGLTVPDHYRNQKCRLTIDTRDDYNMFDNLYTELWKGSPISLERALDYLKENKQICCQNIHVRPSRINKKLSQTRKKWINHLSAICSWDEKKIE